jgi:hypothetical protein
MNSESQHSADDPTLTSSTNSVPIDMSAYQPLSGPDALRSYYDDDTEVKLYLDGAGGVTSDPTRAVLPSSVPVVPDPAPSAANKIGGEPYQPSPDSPYSEMGGVYRGLAAPRTTESTSAAAGKSSASPESGAYDPSVTKSLGGSAGSHLYSAAFSSQRTNVPALLSLIFGLLGFGVVPIVLGHIARSQIRRTGEPGGGMALAGLILGYVVVSLGVVYILVWVVLLGIVHNATLSGN